jgi:hypothetical protein
MRQGWSFRHIREKIDLEGRMVKDGVGKALKDRQIALTDLPSYTSGSPDIGFFSRERAA